jgi:hypothetical protein
MVTGGGVPVNTTLKDISSLLSAERHRASSNAIDRHIVTYSTSDAGVIPAWIPLFKAWRMQGVHGTSIPALPLCHGYRYGGWQLAVAPSRLVPSLRGGWSALDPCGVGASRLVNMLVFGPPTWLFVSHGPQLADLQRMKCALQTLQQYTHLSIDPVRGEDKGDCCGGGGGGCCCVDVFCIVCHSRHRDGEDRVLV